MQDVLVLDGSVDLAVSAWLDAKSKRSGSVKTAKAYANTLRSFRAVCAAAGCDLDGEVRILALLAQGWADQSCKGSVSPSTYNLRLAVVSSFYTYAIRHGLLSLSNPIALVERRPVQDYASAHAIPAERVADALKRIDRTTLLGKRDYALLVVALQTGRRLSELTGMRCQDLDHTGNRIMVTWPHCKGGKVMHDSLPASVGKALVDYLAAVYPLGIPDDASPIWLSCSRNRSRGQSLGRHAVADLCAKYLGTRKVHTLRHTFAVTMEEAGAKVSDIQARLGHASLATTGRYLAELKSAVNAHGERLAHLYGVE